MAKSSPEKLAAALRANLKRRKASPVGHQGQGAGQAPKKAPAGTPPGGLPKPPKNSA